MTDTTHAAGDAATILADIMKIEPMAAGIIGAVVPGAAPIVAIVQPEISIIAPFIVNALNTLQASNGGNVIASIISLIQHMTPGQPIAAPLSTPPAS